MQAENPHVQLRDLWRLLNKMIERGLIVELHSSSTIGRVVYWTQEGEVYRKILNYPELDFPQVNWETYSFLLRGKTRLHVFDRFIDLLNHYPNGVSATQIKKAMRETYPLSLNAVIRSLKELRLRGLVEVRGTGTKSTQPVFGLTTSGEQVAILVRHLFSK
jgi:DNA-binding HxlR family transcriptional regulator